MSDTAQFSPDVWTCPYTGKLTPVDKFEDLHLVRLIFWCGCRGPQIMHAIMLHAAGLIDDITDEIVAKQPETWPAVCDSLRSEAKRRELTLQPVPDWMLEFQADAPNKY